MFRSSAAMGPKKKTKNDDSKQPNLYFFMNDSAHNDHYGTPNSEILVATKITTKDLKVRSFQKHWLELYSWLKYDETSNTMYCSLCSEAKKSNGMTKEAMCANFQMSTLSRHAGLKDHQMLVQAPQLRHDMKIVCQKQDNKHEAAVKILFKALHWIVSEDIPLLKFKSFLDFLHELDKEGHSLSDIRVLKMSNINYDSAYTSSELLECLANVVEDDLQRDIQNSKFVTALADESTDIANNKRLVIYTQLISEDMKPSTRFLTNVQCDDATGKGIANSILEEFHRRGVQPGKIMSLGSDGASVMTGKTNGTKTRLYNF